MNLKNFLWTSVFIFVTFYTRAGVADQTLVCALDQTTAVELNIVQDLRGVEEVTLDVKRDANPSPEPERAAHLKRPGMQTIVYGNVMFASQNYGRSGYAMIRLEQQGGGRYLGHFDLNLFLIDAKPFPPGKIVEIECLAQEK